MTPKEQDLPPDPLELPTHLADRRENLFGGKGVVHVWDLLKNAGTAPFSAVLFCPLAPGGSVGKHAQQRDPELVMAMDGMGTATVDGKDIPMPPLTVVSVPFGSTLALRNNSKEEPFLYVIIKAELPAR